MFNKKTTVERTNFDILIGADSKVDGDLRSKGAIRIDGMVQGDVTSDSKIIISTEASVTGNVAGSEIDLSGRLIGNVSSSGHLKVHPSGVLKGDIEVSSFVIDEGGVFEGACHIDAAKMKPDETVYPSPSDEDSEALAMDPEDIA